MMIFWSILGAEETALDASVNADPYAIPWTDEQKTRKRLQDAINARKNLEKSFVGMPTTKVVLKLGEFDDEIKQLSQELGVGESVANTPLGQGFMADVVDREQEIADQSTKPSVPTMTEPIQRYGQPEAAPTSTEPPEYELYGPAKLEQTVAEQVGALAPTWTPPQNGSNEVGADVSDDYYIMPSGYTDEDYAKELIKQLYLHNQDGTADVFMMANGFEAGEAGKQALINDVQDRLGVENVVGYWKDINEMYGGDALQHDISAPRDVAPRTYTPGVEGGWHDEKQREVDNKLPFEDVIGDLLEDIRGLAPDWLQDAYDELRISAIGGYKDYSVDYTQETLSDWEKLTAEAEDYKDYSEQLQEQTDKVLDARSIFTDPKSVFEALANAGIANWYADIAERGYRKADAVRNEGPRIVNVTCKTIQQVLEENAKLAEDFIGWDIHEFRKFVESDKEWDYKLSKQRAIDPRLYSIADEGYVFYEGHYMDWEEFGNFHLGYVGASADYPIGVLCIGSKVAAGLKVDYNDIPFSYESAANERTDWKWIAMGYKQYLEDNK